jgi:hypothetical protein
MKLILDEEILQKFLELFAKINKNSIIINLPLSIDSKFYNNKNILLKFFELINFYAKNGFEYLDKKTNFKKKFKVEEIQLDIGDTLNRHNFYFWEINHYMVKNNLINYSDIPKNIKEHSKIKSYQKAKNEGLKWFRNNIDIINILLPKEKKINENFHIKDEKTIIYEGNKFHPKISYIRHDYWLNNKQYKNIQKNFINACKEKDSKIKNVFNVEATYFYNKVLKNENFKIIDKKFFIKNAEEYLKDEAIVFTILYKNNINLLEFYLGWENNFSQAFRGKKIKKDKLMQKYLQNELKGADQRKFVSIKLIEEEDKKGVN